MIELQINLMNFSAVTIFLARVVYIYIMPPKKKKRSLIDSNLSWKDHVDHVCIKVNRKFWCSKTVFPAALSGSKTVILPLNYSARLRLWFFSIYSQHSDVSTEAPLLQLGEER